MLSFFQCRSIDFLSDQVNCWIGFSRRISLSIVQICWSNYYSSCWSLVISCKISLPVIQIWSSHFCLAIIVWESIVANSCIWHWHETGLLLGDVQLNVGVLVLGSTSTHECGSTGTLVGVLVLGSTGTHELGSTSTFNLYLTYVEVYLLSRGGQHHPDSWGNYLLSLLENNHSNKAFLDWTGVIIRTNAIGVLLQHYSLEVHPFIPHDEQLGKKGPRLTWRPRRKGTRQWQR